MLQAIKPRNPRAARALAKREPLATENTKTTLFCRYTTCSQICQLVLSDLCSLKRPICIRFNQKNDIRPFEDPTSLEFFSSKNDASLIVFGSHSKKRPHALTFTRMFEHKVLDMLELLIDPETMRTLSQFKNSKKPAAGLKPLITFIGTPFDSPTSTVYTLAKSMLLDFFKGPDLGSVDVEGLQYIISISAGEEVDAESNPPIHLRSYLIKTKKSGQKLPRVEVEEMGPRIDFRIGRSKQPDSDVLNEALKKPATSAPKQKKNIELDPVGDKLGRIHVGKQDFKNLQTRKMKGLKRSRDLRGEDNVVTNGDGAILNGAPEPDGDFKRLKLQEQ